MERIFKIVYDILMWMSRVSGLTYREINIIVFFIIVPLFFMHLIDRIRGKNYFKIGFAGIVLISLFFIENFEQFSSNLFDDCVVFLEWFDIVGWNYTEASVIVCILIPILTFISLVYLKRKLRKKKHNPV